MNFQIKGGKQLHGTIVTNTAKNSAVALICAALLNKNTTTLYGVPRIEEVNRICETLESLRVKLKWEASHILEITPPTKLSLRSLNIKAAIQTRSIILLLGVLIHELKSFHLPQPGGCKLGDRTIRPHFFALEKLGVIIKTLSNAFHIKHTGLKPADIVLYESGDTVTENALMAAAKIKGTTTIKFASSNYQIQDLCYFLTKLGVRIKGIGTTTLIIKGKPFLNKPIRYYISEDPIEAMLFLSVAATTNSQLTIERCPIDFLELELLKLEKMGFQYKIVKRYKGKNNQVNLVDIKTFPSKLTALKEKIYARPYPGLNIDNLPFFVPIATQARGNTLIHDWVYEKRALYYTELTKLGADIILADPHRVIIKGPTKLIAREIICPPALRPAAIILITMLKAKGTSLLRNVYSINRGYENLAKRLNTLGADIKIL